MIFALHPLRTIGWGTIVYPDGTPVRQGDRITQAEADYYLEYEVYWIYFFERVEFESQ